MKKTIYYWSPCLTQIATVKATLNSAISLSKYSNDYDVRIINVCGEWNKYRNQLLENNISIENLSFIQFHYDNATKQLTITQRPRADNETILMHTDNFRPDITLLKDIYSKPWIRDYTLAVCKTMLGEARGKFNTIAGPQGGTTLNGAELKQSGLAEMERLDQEIGNFAEGGTPHSFVIG